MVKSLFLRRVFAYIIDSIVLFFITYPLQKDLIGIEAGYSTIINESITDPPIPSISLLIAIFIIALFTLSYYCILEGTFSQTFGKFIFGIKIRIKNKYLKPTHRQALLRNIAKLSSIILALDTLYMIIKDSNQRYSDKLANTEVTFVVKVAPTRPIR